MARNLSNRKGFTPENATAGIDTTLGDFSINSNENDVTLENEKQDQNKEISMEDTSESETEVNSDVQDNSDESGIETYESTSNSNEKASTAINDQTLVTNKSANQQTQLSLEGLLEEKQKKYDKKQENVWLPPETTRPLQAVSKLVGKTNGGKSKVVDMALQEFFANHPDIVSKAIELYGD